MRPAPSLPASSSSRPPRRARRTKRRRPRYWLRRLVFLLLLAMPFLVWKGWDLARQFPFASTGDAPRVVSGAPVYIAIMGVDHRTEDIGRSDTLILARLDAKRQQVNLISIPRDTRIILSTGETAKINAAYSTGGADRVTEAVSDLLDIPRPYYIKMDLEGFEAIVDKLGGVELDIAKHYVYDDPEQDLHIDIPSGRQQLDGEMALKYVRLRYDGVTNSDIGRIERQQQFLGAMKEKMLSPANWSRIPDMASTLRTYVETNIPEADQFTLLKAIYSARDGMQMQMLPGTPDDRTGDWLTDQSQWREVTETWSAN